MMEVSPKISRQTTIWRASIGFHASHSFGAILFGLIYLYLALAGAQFLFGSKFLLGLGLAYIASMAILAKLYWFNIPFRGITTSAILYVAGVAVSVA